MTKKNQKGKDATLQNKNDDNTLTEEDINVKNVTERVDFPHSNTQEEKEDLFLEGKSIDEIIEEENEIKKGKNYLAIIILLLGALVGSLFVDVAQLLSQKGYSIKALRQADIFTLEDKTWVAYKEPIIDLTILGVSEDKLDECPTCQPPAEVIELFKKVMPTLAIKEIDITNITNISPNFIFFIIASPCKIRKD